MNEPSGARPIVVNGRFLDQPLSGVQRYAAEIITSMDAVLDEDPSCPPVTVYSPRSTTPPEELPRRNVRYAGAGRLRGNAWVQAELPRLSRDATLWSPTNTGPLCGSVVGAGRHVVTIHDAAAFDHPEWFSRKFAAWYGFMLPRVAKRAGRILTVSEFSKERLVETLGLEPEKVSVVYPAADTGRFRPLPEVEVRAALDALGLRRPYLLALGSLEPRKNLPGLIEAWRMLDDSGRLPEELTLFIVGGRASVFRDAGLANLPESVVLGGFIADEHLPGLYCGAGGFVYPSLYEGFGLPPLEAMACGTPVATSDAASLPEVVGDCAVMLDPESTESIANGIESLLADESLRKRLETRGPERAAEFDWRKSAQAVLRHLVEAGR